MVLALPVLHPEHPGHVLLKPGVRLESEMLVKLRQLGVPRLWIQYPPTDYLLRYISPAIMAEHGRLAGRLGGFFDEVTSGLHANFDFHVYAEGVRALIAKLCEDHHAALFIEGLVDSRQPLLAHSANVCLLSLLMGLRLDGYLIAQRARISPRRAQNVENLGVGALLHDIGMLRLDPEVAERFHRTADDADPAYRRHTILGFDMVRGKIPATAAGVVLHHHQRLDGSGYPKRVRLGGPPRALAGDEIHIFSRIVAVADLFDRFSQAPVLSAAAAPASTDDPAPRTPTVRALRQIVELTRARLVDPTVCKALLSVVPAYPPGSLVELNDGRACIVTAWNHSQPCSPIVRPIIDQGPLHAAHPPAHPLQPPEPPQLGPAVDLTADKSLAIRAIDGCSVAADNFHPLYTGEFDLRLPVGGMIVDNSDTSLVA